ncbi:NUDIX domain-containing protein [Histidinibacterium aquaticum]|uniref:NUDIX hydrolase n=1 Tax=Histidinibacterium aquaticum TaxID=2613962 RepID=A0A5J5GCF5_9RHOB|nr:NUDIX hydrolase [Histidinibacterium aquaticum]KAA9005711.1 NUDIX hydrolase [Histidinibacterium aquaticum]
MARPPEAVPVPVRDAAAVILVRDGARVLMGRRGASAVFLPSKWVFPGGAVDPGDDRVPLAGLLSNSDRLTEESAATPEALAAAAIRELWEETGQMLGRPGDWDAPPGWRAFAATGHRPDASALRFVARAVTPPGRPRRFDARFFLAEAEALVSDPDDFSRAEDELTGLHWVPLAEADRLELPGITRLVLEEVRAVLRRGPSDRVPFYRDGAEEAALARLAKRVR